MNVIKHLHVSMTPNSVALNMFPMESDLAAAHLAFKSLQIVEMWGEEGTALTAASPA
jgi:hypothetical protein